MNRRIPIIAAIGGMIAAATAFAGAPAQAAPADHHTSPGVHAAATSTAQQHKVSSYWTAARMRSATPRSVKPGADFKPSSVRTGRPAVVQGQAAKRKPQPSAGSYLGGPWTGGGAVVRFQTLSMSLFSPRGPDLLPRSASPPFFHLAI
jgi:hypothetical protein